MIPQLRCRVSAPDIFGAGPLLISCEQELMDENMDQLFAYIDWEFILAALYLAENENCTEIERTSFSLITTYFAQWHKLYLYDHLEESILV